jgi:membrane protease YdiL (CAAX protease family)
MMGMGLFSSLGLILISAFTDFDLIQNSDQLTEFGKHPEMLGIYRILLIVQHTGQFILPPLLIAYLIGERVRDFLAFRGIDGKRILFTLAVMLFFFPISNFLAELNAGMEFPESLGWLEEKFQAWEEQARSTTEHLIAADSWPGVLRNLLLLAVLPAVGEEMIFRGAIQRFITRMSGNLHLAIWTSAFLFSAMHMQFYGFLPRLALGALFGYMLVRTGTLWVPILAHFLNNAAAVLFNFLVEQDEIPESYEDAGGQEGQGVIILIFFLIVLLLFYSTKWWPSDDIHSRRKKEDRASS